MRKGVDMPRASREAADRTNSDIRLHARRLLAHEGFAALKVEEVAAAAGVTRGAVYHHFGNKLGLFQAVLGDVHASVAEQVAAAAVAEGWEALEAGCIAFLEAALAPDVRRILLVDGPAVLGWEQWRALDTHHSTRHLSAGLAQVEGLQVPLEAAVAVVNGAVNELALWLAAGGDRADGHAALRGVLRGLHAGEGPASGGGA